MATANCVLIRELKKWNRTSSGDLSQPRSTVTSRFAGEIKTLSWTLVFFEASYLLRFLWDEFGTQLFLNKDKIFMYYILYDVVISFDAFSYLALLIFHFLNFRES